MKSLKLVAATTTNHNPNPKPQLLLHKQCVIRNQKYNTQHITIHG